MVPPISRGDAEGSDADTDGDGAGDVDAPEHVREPENAPAERARDGQPHDEAAVTPMIEMGEMFGAMSTVSNFGVIPPDGNNTDPTAWKTTGAALLETFQTNQVNPAALAYAGLSRSWRQEQPEQFNKLIELYRAGLETRFGPQLEKARAEARFNHAEPFYLSMEFYGIAFFVAIFSWLKWPDTLGRSAFWLVAVAWVLSTAGILARMWLEGRPPVTNLYSSALFVGWGSVGLCLVLEYFYRNAIGSVAAGLLDRAGDVAAQDTLVVEAQGERFVVPVEEFLGDRSVIGVDRSVRRNEDDAALLTGAGYASCPLQQTHHAVGEADANHGVESADVDAKLEGVGREHQPHRSVAEAGLDRLPILGRDSGPVHPHERFGRFADARCQHLRGNAAGAERQDTQALLGQFEGHFAAEIVEVIRPADHPEAASALGAAIVVAADAGERLTGQLLKMDPWLANRRRRGDHRGRRPVQCTNLPQPAEQKGNVGTEDPAVGMALIDDHEFQAG